MARLHTNAQGTWIQQTVSEPTVVGEAHVAVARAAVEDSEMIMNNKQKIALAITIVVIALGVGLIAYLRMRAPEGDDALLLNTINPNNQGAVDQGTATSGDGEAAVQISSVSTSGMQVNNFAVPVSPENIEPIGFGEVATSTNTTSSGGTVESPALPTSTASVSDGIDPPPDAGEQILPDADADTIPDVEESRYGTDPKKADTDGDGFSDADEIKNGYNPLGTGKCAVTTCLIN